MSKSFRQILYVCCLTSFITITFAFGRYIFAVITPEIIKNLNLDYEFVGRINAFHQFSYLLFSLLGGLLSSVLGARLLISSSVALCSLSMLSLYFVNNKWILLVIVALQGIFAAISWIPMVELVSRSIAEENRGKSLGIISSGTSYGLILNGVLIPYILKNYNWHTVWLVFGLISTVISLLGVYMVYSAKNTTFQVSGDTDEIKAEENSIDIAGNTPINNNFSQYILLIILMIISGLYLIPFQSYIVPFMQDDLGLDRNIAGISWGLFGVLGIISGFLAGILADKLSAKKAMIIAYGISTASILVLVAFRSAPSVLLSCGIFGLAYNGIFGLHPTYVSRMLPPEKTAKLFGLLNLSLGFGSMVGNYTGGYIKAISGSFISAYVLMFILSIVALIICFFIKGDRCNDAKKC